MNTYETPEIIELGSVAEFTQGAGGDLTWRRRPGLPRHHQLKASAAKGSGVTARSPGAL